MRRWNATVKPKDTVWHLGDMLFGRGSFATLRLLNGVKKLVMVIGALITIIALVGWVKNLIKLANCDFQQPYKAEVIHAVGVIPFVGAFTGWMDFGK